MKKYDILNVQDFNNFLDKIASYISKNKADGKPFKKMSFTVKSYKKDKTPAQHRTFWLVVGKLRKAFKEVGYIYTDEQISHFVKTENGYIDTVILENGRTIITTKSIANDSESINAKVMQEMIDWMIQFAAINLNYVIEIER